MILRLYHRGQKKIEVPNWLRIILFIKNKKLKSIKKDDENKRNDSSVWISDDNETRKLLRLIEAMEKDRKKSKSNEKLISEWHEVARKLDFILFFICLIVVKLTPIILFGKYFFTFEKLRANTCGCDYD
jgi:hypothetical protein